MHAARQSGGVDRVHDHVSVHARVPEVLWPSVLDKLHRSRLAEDVMAQPTHESSPRRPVTERRFKRFVEQVTSRIRRLYKKLRGIETTLEPLADHVGHAEEELHDLEDRVDRLEKTRKDSSR
jgi:septal ring factor EnvC (AmiA/AmiB activator)